MEAFTCPQMRLPCGGHADLHLRGAGSSRGCARFADRETSGGGKEWFKVHPHEIIAAVREMHPAFTQLK